MPTAESEATKSCKMWRVGRRGRVGRDESGRNRAEWAHHVERSLLLRGAGARSRALGLQEGGA